MLKIENIRVPAAAGRPAFVRYAAEALGASESDVESFELLRLSVDSRRKNDVCYVMTAAVALKDERKALKKATRYTAPEPYRFPFASLQSDVRPVVVGMGPAGLFAALCLAEAGVPPLILEQGRPVEQRVDDVERFWRTGRLDPDSNVQFGEGGAGAFSDGKLTTGISDRRVSFILRELVSLGAPEDILYLAKPHVGTDILRSVVKNARGKLLSLGCAIRYGTEFSGASVGDGRLESITVRSGSSEEKVPCRRLVLAPGNASRRTFRMLRELGAAMESKGFAVGVRIEHLQSDVDTAQYGEAATLGTLPASDYKLSVHLPSGRGVFTFCVCPGGSVVAAASEYGGVVTNGMSLRARSGENINGGLLVGVTPDDFSSLFGGMEFQEGLERAAFSLGGGNYRAPAQLVSDFLAHRPSAGPGRVSPSYLPGVTWCDLHAVLPAFVCDALEEALPLMGRKIRGFDSDDAVLTAVETRSSSPVRIVRDGRFESDIRGLFPCGEGAGYAGGITSAAVDGVKCAEAVCASLLPDYPHS